MLPIPRCRLVVAPRDGRLLDSLPGDTRVAAGDVVAHVTTGAGRTELRAPVSGRVGGSLVGADHPVAAGDGVVWLDVA